MEFPIATADGAQARRPGSSKTVCAGSWLLLCRTSIARYFCRRFCAWVARPWRVWQRSGGCPHAAATSLQTEPAGILPGQRMMVGTRMPPSHVLNFAPRSGSAEPPWWRSLRCHGPLSLVKMTTVLSSTPVSLSRFQNLADRVINLFDRADVRFLWILRVKLVRPQKEGCAAWCAACRERRVCPCCCG